MKIIAVVGDSHAWGEGVFGVEDFLAKERPLQGAEMRQIPYQFPTFATLIRNAVNDRFRSDAVEDMTHRMFPVHFATEAKLLRLYFHATEEDSSVHISVNGEDVFDAVIPIDHEPEYYLSVPLHLSDASNISITGTGELTRVEAYSGEYAVVNCGIGSCPSERYLRQYVDERIVPLMPSAVVLEPFTINDWLSGAAPETITENLRKLISRFSDMGAEVFYLTVSPILGPEENLTQYQRYIEAGYKAIENLPVHLCDANAVMNKEISGFTEDQKRHHLFHDDWHPNNYGHRLYAETVLAQLLPFLSESNG